MLLRKNCYSRKKFNHKTNATFVFFLPLEQINPERNFIFFTFNLGNYRCLDALRGNAVIWRVWTCAAVAGQSLLDMASEPSRWGCSLVVRSRVCGQYQPVLDSLTDQRGLPRLEPRETKQEKKLTDQHCFTFLLQSSMWKNKCLYWTVNLSKPHAVVKFKPLKAIINLLIQVN